MSTRPSILRSIDQLAIISFNYDLSLEHFFYTKLAVLSRSNGQDYNTVVDKLLSKIIHVYGTVYDYKSAFDDHRFAIGGGDALRFLSGYARAANHGLEKEIKGFESNIRVIGEERSVDEEHLEQIKNTVRSADRLYILGFGFDEINVSLVGLDALIGKKNYEIHVINYGNSKKIAKILTRIFQNKNYHVSISSNSVYDAIRDEFD